MKSFSRFQLFALVLLTLAACNLLSKHAAALPQGINPYPVQPGDSGLMRGEIRVDSASVRLDGSNPPQVILHFAYFQPTPCFSLRVVPGQPDAQNQIHVSAYAVAPKDKACTLMALATPLQAELSLGSLPKGHYSVWLNGAKVGEVDA